MMNLRRRISALEGRLAQPSGSINVLEKIDLPDAERQILKRAVHLGFVMIGEEQADTLHAAIDALAPSDRHSISRLMEGSTLVVVSGSDANL